MALTKAREREPERVRGGPGVALGLPVEAGGERWNLVAGDALALLERMPEKSVDAAVVDPPYRLSNGGSSCHGGRRVRVDKGDWDASRGVEADHEFHLRWLRACQRVLKPSGTIWVSGTQHAIFSIGFAMQQLGFHLLNTVTWYKPNGAPNLACRFFTHSTELLLWASPAKLRPLGHTFNYPAMKAKYGGGKQVRDLWEVWEAPEPGGAQVVWSVPTPGPKEKVNGRHPTQKPVALLERILLASTSPGDLVLDPFGGSGTTGVAAVRLGLSFIGIEQNPEYVELARKRIRDAEIARGPAK